MRRPTVRLVDDAITGITALLVVILCFAAPRQPASLGNLEPSNPTTQQPELKLVLRQSATTSARRPLPAKSPSIPANTGTLDLLSETALTTPLYTALRAVRSRQQPRPPPRTRHKAREPPAPSSA